MLGKFRGVALISIGAAVGIALVGCQTTKSVSESESVDSDAPEAPAEPLAGSTGEVPTVEEIEARRRDAPPPVEVRPRSRNDFAAQAARYGAEAFRLQERGEWQARKGNRLLTVKESSRVAILDGVAVYLDTPFSQIRSAWALSESDERVVLGGAFGDRPEGPRKIRSIVLDPGHGGSEDGAKNERLGLVEKELNLDLASRLQKHLETMGYKITMTRYEDRLVSLDERPAIANSAKADLFISLHFNAAIHDDAKGLETYMLTPPGVPSTSNEVAAPGPLEHPANKFEAENFELAYRIQKSMLARLQRADRGVRKARFHVLKTLQCPGVLVEGGFLSNADEAPLVGTAGYRERLARSLAEAIDAYAKNTPLEEL